MVKSQNHYFRNDNLASRFTPIEAPEEVKTESTEREGGVPASDSVQVGMETKMETDQDMGSEPAGVPVRVSEEKEADVSVPEDEVVIQRKERKPRQKKGVKQNVVTVRLGIAREIYEPLRLCSFITHSSMSNVTELALNAYLKKHLPELLSKVSVPGKK